MATSHSDRERYKHSPPELLDDVDRGATAEQVINLSHADWVPVTFEQLKHAAEHAEQGDTVYVPGHVTIEWPSDESLIFPEKSTIASDRSSGTPGALLQCDHPTPALVLRPGSELHGFRFEAPQTEHIEWESYDENPTSRGVDAYDGTLIRNCVFRGWGHTGVDVGRDASDSPTVLIERCDFTDNPMGGLGYGGAIARGHGIFRWCYFDNNRHAVASSGDPGTSWTVEDCVHGPHSVGHAFDVHGVDDPDGGRAIAGDRVTFRRNTVLYEGNGVRLRGLPEEGGIIEYNWFRNSQQRTDPSGDDGDAIWVYQADSFEEAGLTVKNNIYGEPPLSWSVGATGR